MDTALSKTYLFSYKLFAQQELSTLGIMAKDYTMLKVGIRL